MSRKHGNGYIFTFVALKKMFDMQVLKFGGTSVGSPQRMREVVSIVTRDHHKKIIVLSAVSGTTNALLEYAGLIRDDQKEQAKQSLQKLLVMYREFIVELYDHIPLREQASTFLEEQFQELEEIGMGSRTFEREKRIVAKGEIISTHLFNWLLEAAGNDTVLLPALNYMRIDKSGEPDEYFIKSMLEKELMLSGEHQFYVTQGYICRNAYGEVDNLKRGGSDYTATLIGQAANAEEIQIWTDIDGMHNNDPRVVDNTFPVKTLSYGEAAELAYFGAKILHPSCVLPAQRGLIPIRLKNTMDPSAGGTLISSDDSKAEITAIAAKDGITAIKVKSGRMLMAYGFLKKIFEIFERYETSIDMITTSEVAVSLTIDDASRLPDILEDLRHYGDVEVDRDQTIICIVGNFSNDQTGYATRIFDALSNVPIRMISYGGSRYNVSILVDGSQKKKALVALNKGLF